VLAIFYKVILIIVRLNQTIMISDLVYPLFILSLMLMPALSYLIKWIP